MTVSSNGAATPADLEPVTEVSGSAHDTDAARLAAHDEALDADSTTASEPARAAAKEATP